MLSTYLTLRQVSICFDCCITGLVYPVVTHWTWASNGWLLNLQIGPYTGFQVISDQSGSVLQLRRLLRLFIPCRTLLEALEFMCAGLLAH